MDIWKKFDNTPTRYNKKQLTRDEAMRAHRDTVRQWEDRCTESMQKYGSHWPVSELVHFLMFTYYDEVYAALSKSDRVRYNKISEIIGNEQQKRIRLVVQMWDEFFEAFPANRSAEKISKEDVSEFLKDKEDNYIARGFLMDVIRSNAHSEKDVELMPGEDFLCWCQRHNSHKQIRRDIKAELDTPEKAEAWIAERM